MDQDQNQSPEEENEFPLDEESFEVEDTEDGGAMLVFEQQQDEAAASDHFKNIVEDVDQQQLETIVSDLLEKISRDKEAREKRDKLYEEGLRRTGLGDDAPGGANFSGANKVVHPMLVEACVDFSARVMKELFPPSGPVKTKIFGKNEHGKLEKAERKAAFMNWQLTEQMPEFRGELEQLSTQLPLGGGQYLKLNWQKQRRRPTGEFVPIDDIYLPFAATNFYSADRRTHVQYVTAAEFERRVREELYIDMELTTPENPEFSKASRANDKIEGRTDTSYNEDGLRTIFEVYTHLDIEGEEAPYILTIDKSTEKSLALYRNWEPDDENKEELEWIVEFPFIPWRGAYPIGLTHMIGGLSGAATGSLRALLDSAHIQNMPTMLKLKGGPNGQTLNLQPTQVAEIEGGAMVDDIRKLAMPVPFNPPSPVLFELMGFLVQAGKGVVQTSFEKLSDMNGNQPVGTTVALIEQGLVVFSSIHSRLHASMARAFKIIHRLNSAYLQQEDIERSGVDVRPEDFDGPMDVIPVSDPAIFSETQRFAQTQAVMQRAAVMPQLYDHRKVEEMFLRAMKLPDDVLVQRPGQDDMDPVSENVAATMGRPVYVLPKQDHITHLKLHMAFLQSPLFGSNPVIARTYIPAIVNHLRDHLLNHYMKETRKAVALATEQQLIEAQPEEEAQIVARVQQLIEQNLGGFGQLLVQTDQAAQALAPKPQMPPDSSLAVANINAQVRAQQTQAQLQDRAQERQQRAQETQAELMVQQQSEQQDREHELRIAALAAQSRGQQEQSREQSSMQETMLREQAETSRDQHDMDVRERMNTADNQTAKELAAAEIASGERIAVSTGTGINPNP